MSQDHQTTCVLVRVQRPMPRAVEHTMLKPQDRIIVLSLDRSIILFKHEAVS